MKLVVGLIGAARNNPGLCLLEAGLAIVVTCALTALVGGG